jgi:hypothetical protein
VAISNTNPKLIAPRADAKKFMKVKELAITIRELMKPNLNFCKFSSAMNGCPLLRKLSRSFITLSLLFPPSYINRYLPLLSSYYSS